MVHELNGASGRVIRDCLGRRDSADSTGVDLNVSQPGEIDHIPGLLVIVTTFSAGESQGTAPAR